MAAYVLTDRAVVDTLRENGRPWREGADLARWERSGEAW
jgi:hypothetical protein